MSSGSCCGNMKKGSGYPSAPWLGEVREAIKESVPEPREDGFTLESTTTRKVITSGVGVLLGLTKSLIFG